MASHELQVEPQVAEIPRLIDWISACCGDEGIAEEIGFKMALALEEAVMNVITHAFAGVALPHLITIRLEINAELLVAEIVDNGRPFDPTTAPDPDLSLPLEQRHPGGLGIHLMRGMMDGLRYRRSNGRNILRLEKARA
jgi:anti-sigma regulatory factor (Ser/Thr protein kinase)